MKYAAIFLNGTYRRTEDEFNRQAIQSARKRGLVVAVDGALELFHGLKMSPHCLLGDFDSVSKKTLNHFVKHHPELDVVVYPRDKDATDGELAVRYVIENGCDFIEIFGAYDDRFESDQMLANILLLAIPGQLSRKNASTIVVRLVDHKQHLYLIENSTMRINGKKNDMLSILPLSSRMRITLKGTKWNLTDHPIRFGSSQTLRNCFSGKQATISTKGRAIVVHRYRAD